jgi:hypothetical protein
MAQLNTAQYNTRLFNTQTVPQLNVPAPKNPRAYLGTQEDTYVFMWTINCCVDCGGGLNFVPLSAYDFELCIDTDPSFSSVNLRCFTEEDARTGFGIGGFGEGGFGIGGFAGGFRGFAGYDKGQIVIAFEILFPIRAEAMTIPYYWRVKASSGSVTSDYTDTQTFIRDLSNKQAITTTLYGEYPDLNYYVKDANSTFTYTIASVHSREIEEMDFEAIRSKRDIYLTTVRDESLYNNFGVLYSYQNTGQTLQEYREQLIQLIAAYQISGTFGALQTLVAIFTCTQPVIQEVKDLTGWRIFSATDPEPNRPHYYIKDPAHPTLSPIITIYSKAEKAYAFYLIINNSFNLTIDEAYLKSLVYQLIPAYAKASVVFH